MSVKLLYTTPLWLISNGIRQSHNTTNKADSYWLDGMGTECPYCGSNELEESISSYECNTISICKDCGANLQIHIGEKDYDLIKRVGFHMNHSSVLEHSLIVFEVKMTTKALLEESRHRIGVSQTVTSSRYALDIIDVEFETIPDPRKEEFAKKQQKDLLEFIDTFRNEKGRISKKDMDELAMLLPQNFIYKLQLTFNFRSLVHFIKLRINKSAHYTIRKIAFEILKELPPEWQELVLLDEKINKNYKELLNEYNK